MSKNAPKLPQRNSGPQDTAAMVARAVAGLVPFVGTAIGEVITQLIPNQRMERCEDYIRYLGEELERLAQDSVQERIRTPEAIDLIEDGAYQAVRAISDERRRYIARCVASGIIAAELDHIRERRLLTVLSQLDDEEILILDAFASKRAVAQEKFARLLPERPAVPCNENAAEEYALSAASIEKLKRLSLIYLRGSMDAKAQRELGLVIPVFDAISGEPSGHKVVSPLGKLLLRKIGLR